jgi:hypothetical protein
MATCDIILINLAALMKILAKWPILRIMSQQAHRATILKAICL